MEMLFGAPLSKERPAMKISHDIEKLFDEWALEAARDEKGFQIYVLALKKRIIEHLQNLFPGDDFVEADGQTYKIREYVKKITDYAQLIKHTEIMMSATRNVLDMCRENDY
jgi:GDP-D-mannose dehydratase